MVRAKLHDEVPTDGHAWQRPALPNEERRLRKIRRRQARERSLRAAERSDLEDPSERLLGRLNVRRQNVRRPDMAQSAGPVRSTFAFGGILLAIRHQKNCCRRPGLDLGAESP